ncbi:hypothetical protein D7X94_05570 [Acutalibacter sp. 1XD8-33]|uniref:alpha/beta hydrolase n=1 Tax=Acutalibacter sp. 1XD8-33 TaxID=2320081 RepID=UPI000EA29EB7|nr:alpha/beta hydrolase family protein [Acutalibacter sp. 1XD8-33]RKJ40879.1 hypothetical protein D7X94_05570 [Acutalibacter sp. 1XD8-33]
MSLVHLNFESAYLGNNTDVNIILPDRPKDIPAKEFFGSGETYKVLWLLHGTFGDYTDWIRKSNIEPYASQRNLIVVMPSAANANYVNWPGFATGYHAWDYLTEELMPLVQNWFPASKKREDNFIAGLSMGGNGAMQYAAGHPELFAGAASLSNAPSNLREIKEPKYEGNAQGGDLAAFNRRVQNVIDNFGGLEGYVNSPVNVWDKLPELMKAGTLPKLYFCCGEEDPLIWEKFQKFQAYAEEIGLPARFDRDPGYTHEWRYWDLTIQRALDYFGITPIVNALENQ